MRAEILRTLRGELTIKLIDSKISILRQNCLSSLLTEKIPDPKINPKTSEIASEKEKDSIGLKQSRKSAAATKKRGCEACTKGLKPEGYFRRNKPWWCETCLKVPRIMKCSFRKGCKTLSDNVVSTAQSWACSSCLERRRAARQNAQDISECSISGDDQNAKKRSLGSGDIKEKKRRKKRIKLTPLEQSPVCQTCKQALTQENILLKGNLRFCHFCVVMNDYDNSRLSNIVGDNICKEYSSSKSCRKGAACPMRHLDCSKVDPAKIIFTDLCSQAYEDASALLSQANKVFGDHGLPAVCIKTATFDSVYLACNCHRRPEIGDSGVEIHASNEFAKKAAKGSKSKRASAVWGLDLRPKKRLGCNIRVTAKRCEKSKKMYIVSITGMHDDRCSEVSFGMNQDLREWCISLLQLGVGVDRIIELFEESKRADSAIKRTKKASKVSRRSASTVTLFVKMVGTTTACMLSCF